MLNRCSFNQMTQKLRFASRNCFLLFSLFSLFISTSSAQFQQRAFETFLETTVFKGTFDEPQDLLDDESKKSKLQSTLKNSGNFSHNDFITIKLQPALSGIKITSFSTDNQDNLFKSSHVTTHQGSISLDRFESRTCLVAQGISSSSNQLIWLQKCFEPNESIQKRPLIWNLKDQKVHIRDISITGTDPDGTSFFDNIPLVEVPVSIGLTSEIHFSEKSIRNPELQVTLNTNNLGKIEILSNVKLTGNVTVKNQFEFNNLESKLEINPNDLDKEELQFSLLAKCPDRLTKQASINGLSSLTRSFGFGPKPLTRSEAEASGWQSVNQDCNESRGFPGFRYENIGNDADQFLVLIYNGDGILSGVQVATPVTLADPKFDYEDNPFYIKGTFYGEAAYLATVYFSDRQSVCETKSAIDLICADGLGGNDDDVAYIIRNDLQQTPLFLHIQAAKDNGWSLSERTTRNMEKLLEPPGKEFSPFLGIYKDSKLVGLSVLNQIDGNKQAAFSQSIFEPLLQELTNQSSTIKESTLMTSLYISDNDRVHVHLKLRLGEYGHLYPRKYYYWTDAGDHGERREFDGRLDRFSVRMTTKHIYLFGYNDDSATVHYAIVRVDPCRGSYDIQATIRKGEKSQLHVLENQIDDSLDDAVSTVFIGVASKHAMKAKLKLGKRGTVYMDTPRGTLLTWAIEGPHHQRHLPHPERGYGIAPFHKEVYLLKTINVEAFVCLKGSQGHSFNAANKDAQVEISFEYEWASQDDKREIASVDHHGRIFLKDIPLPKPGEALNVTFVSKISRQTLYDKTSDFHAPIAAISKTIFYEEEKLFKIDFCHSYEQLVVVVSNGVTFERVSDAEVVVVTDSDREKYAQDTNEDGIASFSFQGPESFSVKISKYGFDEVQVVGRIQEDGSTKVIHADLLPQQKLSIELTLEDGTPALGSAVAYILEDGLSRVQGSNEKGSVIIMVPGTSETIQELIGFLPQQSTCGTNMEELTKLVYGISRLSNLDFPLIARDGKVVYEHMVLPTIDQVSFAIGLDGTFPDVAELSTNIMAMDNRTLHVEQNILDNVASVALETGSRQGYLFTMEWYTNNVIATPLNPCVLVDLETTSEGGRELQIRQSIYDQTVKVIVKTVDQDYNPVNNVTIRFIMGETEFGVQSMDVSDEGEMYFHLSFGTLVSIDPVSPYKPDPSNPQYFVARPDLIVYLLFDVKNSHNVIVELVGEDFIVPEDTLVRYIAVADDGEVISSEALFTDEHSRVYFRTRRDVQYIEFSIMGSDGFDPVFYQPFDYVYNITNPSWTPPLMIEIPVRTLKNIIVGVRDCYTGELIEGGAVATVPQDAPRWNSWFNPSTMSSNYEGRTDDQGIVFFNVEPDQWVLVHVKAKGYRDFHDNVHVKSNVTYFVEANLCKDLELSFQLVDAGRNRAEVAGAVVIVTHGSTSTEVTTNQAGKGFLNIEKGFKDLHLQIVDGPEDMEDPVFELHDESDFLKTTDVDIRIGGRARTISLQTSNCDGSVLYPDVPVLVSVCHSYSESCFDPATQKDINSYLVSGSASHAPTIIKSSPEGILSLRVDSSVTKVTFAILAPPPSHPDAVNVAILPQGKLPSYVQFTFYNLKKSIFLSVRDPHEERIPGALVKFSYFDPSINSEVNQELISDLNGKTNIDVDGCVREVTIRVEPPESGGMGGQCYNGNSHNYGRGSYETAIRSNLNVMKDQKFKITLKESNMKDYNKKVPLQVKSSLNNPDEIRLTTDVEMFSPITLNSHKNPFVESWTVEIPSSSRRVFLSQVDRSASVIGLVDMSLCCYNGKNTKINGFVGSVMVNVKVLYDNGDPALNAKVIWHMGHGLGTVWSPVDTQGHVRVWAPPGEPLFLRVEGTGCSHTATSIEDAKDNKRLTLICKMD